MSRRVLGAWCTSPVPILNRRVDWAQWHRITEPYRPDLGMDHERDDSVVQSQIYGLHHGQQRVRLICRYGAREDLHIGTRIRICDWVCRVWYPADGSPPRFAWRWILQPFGTMRQPSLRHRLCHDWEICGLNHEPLAGLAILSPNLDPLPHTQFPGLPGSRTDTMSNLLIHTGDYSHALALVLADAIQEDGDEARAELIREWVRLDTPARLD